MCFRRCAGFVVLCRYFVIVSEFGCFRGLGDFCISINLVGVSMVLGGLRFFSGPGAFCGSMCLIAVCKWTRWFWVTQWTSCFGVKDGLLCG